MSGFISLLWEQHSSVKEPVAPHTQVLCCPSTHTFTLPHPLRLWKLCACAVHVKVTALASYRNRFCACSARRFSGHTRQTKRPAGCSYLQTPFKKKKLVTLNITWCLLEVWADSEKGEVLNPWSVGWFISRKVLPLCYWIPRTSSFF